MKKSLNDLSTFLNDSKKQFDDAAKKDKELRDDVAHRLSDLEARIDLLESIYADLIKTINPIF